MMDVSYLLQSSLTVSNCAAHERALLEAYVNAMRKLGATISYEEILFYYPIFSAVTALISVFIVVDALRGPTRHDPKTRRIAEAYAKRIDAVANRWNVVHALDVLLSHVAVDGQFSAYSPADYRDVVPKAFHDLLDEKTVENTSSEEDATRPAEKTSDA